MLRYILILCIAFSLCTCAGIDISKGSSSPEASKEANYWITLPKSNELVFIGVSGPQSKRDAEITIAREDAARKASMYHDLIASYVSVQSIGSGFLDYFADSDIQLRYDNQIEKYIEKLNYDPERDVVTMDGAIFIRFTYPAAFPGNIAYSSGRNPNGSPEWTNRPPSEIGGFLTGVGFARKQMRKRDTIAKSSEAAAAALVSRINSSVSTKEVSARGENATVVQQQSIGRLSNFLILEMWMDPETEAVWTLAIARVSG